MDRSWRYVLDKKEYNIKIKFNPFFRSVKLYIEGRMLCRRYFLFDMGEELILRCEIDGAILYLLLRRAGMAYDVFLFSDEGTLKLEKMGEETEQMPIWTWLFIISCAAIPILSVEGIIPIIIGIAGITRCVSISRNISLSFTNKIASCFIITAASWGVFWAFNAALSNITAYIIKIYQ